MMVFINANDSLVLVFSSLRILKGKVEAKILFGSRKDDDGKEVNPFVV